MADEEVGTRAEQITLKKYAATMLSSEVRRAIQEIPDADVSRMKEIVRRYIPNALYSSALVDLLDWVEDHPYLYFRVFLKDGTDKLIKIPFEARNSKTLVKLIIKYLVIAGPLQLFTGETKDVISAEAYMLEQQRGPDRPRRKNSFMDAFE